ncbi:unnamed protein product [Effrenium voratum]|nr:unnamed protein product [Effrenium voratum]
MHVSSFANLWKSLGHEKLSSPDGLVAIAEMAAESNLAPQHWLLCKAPGQTRRPPGRAFSREAPGPGPGPGFVWFGFAAWTWESFRGCPDFRIPEAKNHG